MRLIPIIIALAMSSCLSGYDVASADVSPVGWNTPAEIRYTNRDTLSTRDLSLVFRHGAEVSPAGVEFLVGCVSPAGVEVREEVSVVLASDLKEARVPFRRRVMLSETGNYVFTVTPGQSVFGVWSVAVEFK